MEISNELIFTLSFFIVFFAGLTIYFIKELAKAKKQFEDTVKEVSRDQPEQKSYDLVLERLERHIKGVPEGVLRSIKGSVSDVKGHMGELISFLQVRSQYDRLIILGDICDFIGIKFPSEKEKGHIHFIDIKAGKFARLSKDQTKLKKIIESGDFEFQKISVSMDSVSKKETHEKEPAKN